MNGLKNESRIDALASVERATQLLNQQIWCWGQDIEYAEGNLLVRHGFLRIEKPGNSHGASLYRLDLSSTTRVILRGFGVFIGDDRWGGMFLRRFEFKPQLTPKPDLSQSAWMADDLPPLAKPTRKQVSVCQGLLGTLIVWVRAYEVWILETMGAAYRKRTLINWKPQQGSKLTAEEMANEWRLLAMAVSDDPLCFIPCRGSGENRRVSRRPTEAIE